MITKTNQSLSNIFGVEPTAHEVIEHETKIVSVVENAQDTDFEIARTTMHNLLLKGQSAIENALLIANGTEEADSYNAVSNLIGKMTDATVKLMGLHEMKAKINTKQQVAQITPELGSTTNISGPVFVGSTSELAKMISDQRKQINTSTI